MSRFLLDTQAVILWGAGSLSELAQEQLEQAEAVYLSPASAWEMIIKAGIGKLTFSAPVEAFVSKFVDLYHVDVLPITLPHALKIADLPRIHKDPFDRILMAQALVEDLTIATNDKKIELYPYIRIMHI